MLSQRGGIPPVQGIEPLSFGTVKVRNFSEMMRCNNLERDDEVVNYTTGSGSMLYWPHRQ